MIVWSEKKGHRRQRPAKQVCSIRRIEFEEMGRNAPTIIDKVQITKTSTILNEGTPPLNPQGSAPYSLKEL